MFLPKLSVMRPVTVSMAALALIICGLIAFGFMPVDLLPNVSQPILRVYTSYPGGTPGEIEQEITKKLEDEFTTLKQLASINSVSRADESEIVLSFNWSKKIELAIMEAQEKIDNILKDLPEGAENPVIEKSDPNSKPILIYNCISSLDPSEFAFNLTYKIKPELERCDGVARVKIIGIREPEIRITLDSEKLFAKNITIEQVIDRLEKENLNYQGGKLKIDKYDILVRTIGEFKNAAELNNLILRNNRGSITYLKDVGKVSESFKPASEILRMNGKESVFVEIYKESGSNTMRTSQNVKSGIEKLTTSKKAAMFNAIYDQSIYINESIEMVKGDAIQGTILAVLIVYFFLRSITSTLIICSCLPASIVGSFILFYFSGMSINIFSLAGLSLAVGSVIDTAVVLLENIYRHMGEGRQRLSAAITACVEVGPAVMSSAATSLAVFVPIIFISGQAGIIFRDLALVITYSTLISLLVGFTLIPMLSSKFLTVYEKSAKKNFMIKLFDKFDTLLFKVYEIALSIALGTVARRIITFSIGAGLIVLVYYIIPLKEFFPQTNQNTIELTVYFEKGLSMDATTAKYSEIETEIKKISDVKIIAGTIKSSIAYAMIILKDNLRTHQIIEEIKTKLSAAKPQDFLIEMYSPIETAMGLTGSGNILIKIIGADQQVLNGIANELHNKISKEKGIEKIISNVSDGIKVLYITIDPVKAGIYGISLKETGEELKRKLSGELKTSIRQDNRTLDVRVIGDSGKIKNIEDIKKIYITSPAGIKVKLSEIADVRFVIDSDEIFHDGKEKSVSLKIWVQQKIPLGEVLEKISNSNRTGIIDKVKMPDGYRIKMGGLSQALLDSFRELMYSILFAIAFVYMIMAGQFESLLHPFTILLSVPLALLGAFLGLHIMGIPLSITALIGLIMLVGIAVNNAIILIDYTNILRRRGIDRFDAIKEAGTTRLRPILITAFTTVIAMLPMCFGVGSGAELYQGLAVVTSFGLLLSTILTLVYIPTIYCLFDDIIDMITLLIFKIKFKFEKVDTID